MIMYACKYDPQLYLQISSAAVEFVTVETQPFLITWGEGTASKNNNINLFLLKQKQCSESDLSRIESLVIFKMRLLCASL